MSHITPFPRNNGILRGQGVGHSLCSYFVSTEAGLSKCGVTKKGVCAGFLSLALSLPLPTYSCDYWCGADAEFFRENSPRLL